MDRRLAGGKAMTMFLFFIFFVPGCAALAGFVLWASSRNHVLEDGELLRSFLILLFVCLALVGGASQTSAARMYLDPHFRLLTELDAHPVYAAIKRVSPDDHRALHAFLMAQMSRGATLPEAFLQARPLLTRLTNDRLGFTDQKSRILWGRVTADSFSELQDNDPMLCYQVLSLQPLDRLPTFSADNTKAFQQALIKVYDASSEERRKVWQSDEHPVGFNDAAIEYRTIKDDIAQQYGKPVAERLDKRIAPDLPSELAEQMCGARTMQLEAMLERSQAMASRLIDSVLR